MENGVERVDGVQLGGGELVVNGDKVQESVGMGPEADLEDEVFEEAVGDAELVPVAEPAVSAVVARADEGAGAVHERETFEEASDAPDDKFGAVVEEEKIEELVAAESIDKIDEGGTNQEVEAAELDGGKEVLEVDSELEEEDTNQEVEAELDGGKEVVRVDGNGGHEVSKNGDDVVTRRAFELAGEASTQDVVTEEVDRDMKEGIGFQETRGLSAVLPDFKEVKDEIVNFEVPGEALIQDAAAEEVQIVSQETRGLADVLHELKEVKDEEANGKSTLETRELADGLLGLEKEKREDGDEKVTTNGEREYEENGQSKNDMVLESQNGVYYNHLRDGPSGDDQHQGPRSDDSKGVLDLENSNHHEEAPKTKVSSADLDEPVVVQLAAPDLTSVPSSEKSLTKDSQAHSADLKSDDKMAPQLSKQAEIVGSFEKIDPIVEKQEKETIEPPKEKQNAPSGGQRYTQSGPRLAPPPSKPASSAASPTRPVSSAASLARPAGLGSAAPLLEPAPRASQPSRVNGTMSHPQSQQIEESTNGEAEEYDETREKLQMIRVKFLRLSHRLGQTPHNVVVAQVLYRLGLAEQLRGRNGGRVGAFSFDRASAMAEQLEAAGQEALDFSCTIMVIGKSGVGKSATINSIFDEVKFSTDAFQTGTKKVQDVVGTVQGIKVRVIDTPGLLPSWSDQRQNEKILLSVKHFIKKTPPDIVLYLDRLDMQSRDFGDMPLLRTITEIFGPSIWFNAIVVLTHAASAPPDGPNGTASSYDMFVTQRLHVVQQAIRQAAGDMRLMNPISLVENHSACRTNRAGQRVLPNGQIWKPHLLLLSFASKILAEANTLLKLQDSPPGAPFAPRSRAPPLPFLLSSLLQSRPQLKLPDEQFGDDDGLDDDLDESSDSEEEPEFKKLPTFKSLTKAQVAKLTKEQKNAYFDELEYREKLLMKKQLKEEKRRRRAMKKSAAGAADISLERREGVEEESGGAASVPVPMPDLALPASFDSDNPTHRYRYLDGNNQWLVRPVLETHGWDHDIGYEGINVERLFAVKDKVPVSFSGQVTKDKKDASVQMEVASSIKHGVGKATSLGFDMQTVGKDLAYTFRSETRFSNYRKNKATAGISLTLLGDAVSAGVKVEDKLIANKRFQMVISGGAMTGRGDVAYGGSLEAQVRDKDHPLGRSLSTLGLSVMDWHGDLAVGCNLQSQVPIGRSTNLIARANLNNRGAGQIGIRVNSSEQLQLALVALIPLLKKLIAYPHQIQFGQ